MAQKTFVDGDVLTASDINTYLMGEGGAWTSYTPTIAQGASTDITKTVTYSKYARHGRMITFVFQMTLTANGTAASVVTVSVPVAASATAALQGVGSYYDSSTTTNYGAHLAGLTTTTVQFLGDWSGTSAWGFTPNLAAQTSDVLYGSITYEAAS